MILITEDSLTKQSILKSIRTEMKNLNDDLESERDLKKRVIAYLRSYIVSIDYSDTEDVYHKVGTINNYIKKVDQNIIVIEKLVSYVLDIKVNAAQNTLIQIVDSVKQYNKEYKEVYKIITPTTRKINRILDDDVIENKESIENKYKENTLIISEKQGKVFLPFTMNRIYEILQYDNTYSSVEDVIDKLYTKPIAMYKNPAKARFTESYKLIIEREHGSKKQAIDLGLELMFNSNLHPAIITSCKTLDELDVYLSCLEYNELDDFKFFDIEYEVSPELRNKASTTFKFFKNMKPGRNVEENQ